MDTEVQPSELVQAFRAFVREKGGRFTPEREAIVEGIEKCNSHFTLEELKLYMQKTRFRVSLATLYNTLNELVTARLLSRCLIRENTFYEISFNRMSHCHQVCSTCGRIVEFESPELDAKVREQKYRRFTLAEYSLVVYGMCSSCKANLKRAKKKNKINNNAIK